MPRLSDRIPEPAASWTQEHSPNPLEGVVTARREVHSEKLDRDFAVLEIVEDNGQDHEILCGRADLASIVHRLDPQVGDRVALKYWGVNGSKNIYTAVSDRPEQGRFGVDEQLGLAP